MDPIVPNPANSGSKGSVTATNVVINDIPPTFIGTLAMPIYPAPALAAHLGECVIYATIVIDTEGRVADVKPSFGRLNFPTRYSDEFFDAVRIAVMAWKFVPARNVYWEKAGDGDLKYLRTEPIPAQTDVKFTFEASGRVY